MSLQQHVATTPTEWLDGIPRYVPGRPSPAGGLALASNESQYGCSPTVFAALASMTAPWRYPEPMCAPLREQIAQLHGVQVDQVLVGNGSDELVGLLATAHLRNGGRAVAADPGYAMNRITARVAGGQFKGIPLREWRHDLPAMAATDADLMYVVNPHNPTGTTCPIGEIERAVERFAGLTVVDEAYLDFADDPARATAIPLAADNQAVVLRTFSKAYGLAGLRVGYLIGPAGLVDHLARARAPFSVNAAAQVAARAALRDTAFLETHVRQNRRAREALQKGCAELGITCVSSQTNFVLTLASDEEGTVRALRAQGIAVRGGATLGVPGTIRITVPHIDQVPRLLNGMADAVSSFLPTRPHDGKRVMT